MAIEHEDNDVPYRSPMDDVREDTDTVTTDEEDFSTLRNVYRDLKKEYDNLDNESVFDLKEDELSIKEQIAANRRAKTILEPALASLKSAIDTVKQKQGGA